MVERQLCKLEVADSISVSSTNLVRGNMGKQTLKAAKVALGSNSLSSYFIEKAKTMMDNKTIAVKLFLMRCKRRVTLNQMAKQLGISKCLLFNYENKWNEEFRISDLERYAYNLDIPITIRISKKKGIEVL